MTLHLDRHPVYLGAPERITRTATNALDALRYAEQMQALGLDIEITLAALIRDDPRSSTGLSHRDRVYTIHGYDKPPTEYANDKARKLLDEAEERRAERADPDPQAPIF